MIVKCSNANHPEAGSASFEFSYYQPAAVMTLSETQASADGGTVLIVEIDHFTPVSSIDQLSVIFNDATGSSTIASQAQLVYSKEATLTSAAKTKLTVTTPAAPNGPGEVELKVVSATQSSSQTFLFVDTSMEIIDVSGVHASAASCASIDRCHLSAAGRSLLRVNISNFPYTTTTGERLLPT